MGVLAFILPPRILAIGTVVAVVAILAIAVTPKIRGVACIAGSARRAVGCASLSSSRSTPSSSTCAVLNRGDDMISRYFQMTSKSSIIYIIFFGFRDASFRPAGVSSSSSAWNIKRKNILLSLTSMPFCAPL